MRFISEIKAKFWKGVLDRFHEQGNLSKASMARHELHCWEYVNTIEKHATAIIEQASKSTNVPGELRYHIEALAKHVSAKKENYARIAQRSHPVSVIQQS